MNSYFERIKNDEEGKDGPEDILGAFVSIKALADDKNYHEWPFFHLNEGLLRASALKTFISVPWWTRIWTLQEAVLAQNATIIFNSITAPWPMVAQAVGFLRTHVSSCCSELDLTLPNQGWRILDNLFDVVTKDIQILRKFREDNTPISSFEVTFHSSGRSATDVRVEVYGILGLVTNWYGSPPLQPDYQLSPAEVYMEATLRDIKGSNTLQILFGTTRADIPDAPSWITQIGTSEELQRYETQRMLKTRLFKADGLVAGAGRVQRNGSTLILACFNHVDKIAYVGPIMFADGREYLGDVIATVKIWSQMAGLGYRKLLNYSMDQTWKEVFYKTIINDSISPRCFKTSIRTETEYASDTTFQRLGANRITELAQAWWNWLQKEARQREKHHGGLAADRGEATEKNGYSPPTINGLIDIKLFYQSFRIATAFRKFFITTEGRMGLGPPSLLPNDDIFVLLGGDTPFATRPHHSGQDDILVGDVYVHGLMDGEGVPDDWKDKVRKLHLR